MLYPLTFQPILKERVWGGRSLATLYKKTLPHGAPIGESWEISDRPGDASVISNGPLAGKDLRWLMERHGAELLGTARSRRGRFPLLAKILDARQVLSLQVHPPEHKAAELGGESKSELWYVAQAEPGAEIYAGLRRGVDRAAFERGINDGSVAQCFHRIRVKAGDAIFLPSGRVHALGAGIVVFEIQLDSDTTYRAFDWNRTGLDGKPRELHLAQSLASIDFGDYEPELISAGMEGAIRPLVKEAPFTVELWRLKAEDESALKARAAQIVGCLSGGLRIKTSEGGVDLEAGQFCLIPAACETARIRAVWETAFLRVEPH